MKTAVVGAGTIGGGMVLRLLREGHSVAVFDVDGKVIEALSARGARPASSAAQAAEGSEYVVTSLPRSADVEMAFGGPSGILAGVAPGTVIVEASTVPPAVIQALVPKVTERGALLVDAPITPSLNQQLTKRPVPPLEGPANVARESALAGNLCFFVGGEPEAVAKARPLLEVLGLEHHHLGPIGAGKTAKLVHNGINMAELAMISEMFVIAERAGVALDRLLAVLQTTLADSTMLRNHVGRYTVPGNFPRGLFPISYAAKDVAYVLEAAAAQGVKCSVASAVQQLYERASQSPYRDYYVPSIFRFIEDESPPKAPI